MKTQLVQHLSALRHRLRPCEASTLAYRRILRLFLGSSSPSSRTSSPSESHSCAPQRQSGPVRQNTSAGPPLLPLPSLGTLWNMWSPSSTSVSTSTACEPPRKAWRPSLVRASHRTVTGLAAAASTRVTRPTQFSFSHPPLETSTPRADQTVVDAYTRVSDVIRARARVIRTVASLPVCTSLGRFVRFKVAVSVSGFNGLFRRFQRVG